MLNPFFSVTPSNYIRRAGILTSCPSTSAFAIALGSPNPPPISVAEETLDFRGPAFSAGLRLLMPTFSLPYAPPRLTAETSSHMKCSPTTPMLRIGSTKSQAPNNKQAPMTKIQMTKTCLEF